MLYVIALPGVQQSPSIRIEFWMLSVSQVYLCFLFGSRIETVIRLVRVVARLENNSNRTRFRQKRLRLFNFATIRTGHFFSGRGRRRGTFARMIEYLKSNRFMKETRRIRQNVVGNEYDFSELHDR